jgi:tagatose-6-phosphate ketose/aldose isomerase
MNEDIVVRGDRGGATGREIGQQPAMWRQTAAIVAEDRERLDALTDPILSRPGARVIFTGAGSSAYAGGLICAELAHRRGVRMDAVATTDIVSNPRDVFAEDVPTLLVSFARSGDSPESIAATSLANQLLTVVGHLVITCNADGALARAHAACSGSEVLLLPPETNDAGFAMTSSFTSMALAALLVFAPELEAHVESLAGEAEDLLRGRLAQPAAIARRSVERVVYLGSGCLHALAQESALKVLELTGGRVVAISESSLGFRHGPKSILSAGTAVVCFLSNDPYTRRYDEDIAAELQSIVPSDLLIRLSSRGEGLMASDSASSALAQLPDAMAGIALLLFAQVLALDFSLSSGVIPDNPSPSGAVNRVVRGVTIHALDAA